MKENITGDEVIESKKPAGSIYQKRVEEDEKDESQEELNDNEVELHAIKSNNTTPKNDEK